jgi:O-glycosyl hydrolase
MAQQTIYGFGGADIIDWTGDLTTSQRDTAFSPTTGIGLSIVRVRVPVDSSEFNQAKATIDACKSYGGFAIASVWSAPAYMKTNDSTSGGTIKTDSYADFAAYLKDFNTAAGGLAAISPTNEPNIKVSYESMEMSSSQVADFVAAEGDSCGASIMAPEPFNMDPTYISTYLSNPAAKSKTAFIAGHIYGATPYNLSADKPVWMTEHYINSNLSGDDWKNAMNVAKEINDCMDAGWGAYVWWYIRRSYGPISENGTIQKLGYVMAQYARYIRPGYKKISCTENPSADIYTTAYKSGSRIVVVIINQNSSGIFLSFNFTGATVSALNRYTTTNSSNLAADSISIQGSVMGTTLPAMSVTTLVSK